MKTFLQDTIDFLKYDLLLQNKPELDKSVLSSIPKEFRIKANKGEEGVTITFPDFPGIILYSDYNSSSEEFLNIINDGLSVYYDIPRYHAKTLKIVKVLKDSKGRIIAQLPANKDNLLRAYN